MLELIEVSKRYSNVIALHPTSLLWQPQTTYALLGTSGCGKSTLLKVALGLVRPDSGTVKFDSVPLTSTNADELRQRVGYVIQHGGLFPHLTAAENVSLVARHLGWNRSAIDSRLAELAELTQLKPALLKNYPNQLSGGQQQRISLIRALFLDPEILLMDEPLGALDPIIRSDLQQDLREIFRALRKTVVLVTHDLHEAVFFADEIVLLRSGSIVQRGTIEEFIESPTDPFVTKFVSAQRTALQSDP